MGYEVTLKIGRLGMVWKEGKRSKEGIIDGKGEGASVYYPYLKDDKGDTIPTGRKECTFSEYAHADLCKIGEGPLENLRHKSINKNTKLVYKWFCGNNELSEDGYGDKYKPVSLHEVIKALQGEIKATPQGEEPYRRFVWALALCKAVAETTEGEFIVMFEGH